jgi:asparagine synthase (glutamine-hydrolysing)
LSESALRHTGCFDVSQVVRFIEKCRRQAGSLQGERENMALVGILSIQLLDHLFIRQQPAEALEQGEAGEVAERKCL